MWPLLAIPTDAIFRCLVGRCKVAALNPIVVGKTFSIAMLIGVANYLFKSKGKNYI